MQKDRALGVLRDVFGYKEFRPMQEKIIHTLLNKQDCLVIMPTGGGKSLCYQIPAILFPGLTLVVSPLISLMQDQVQQLQALGVAAEVLNSSLNSEDYRKVMGQISRKELVLLYMAPETLMKASIQDLLSQVSVDCITIDEAHCISEWGHDFRPEYRLISQIRERFPKASMIGLTATATEQVQQDIRRNLRLKNEAIYISSFDRKNLFLQVEERYKGSSQLLSFIKRFPDQSGIIYCFSRRRVDQLNSMLQEQGFSVLPYHAGLSDQERQEHQYRFIRDDVQIMVATVAFGMGINKPNVRFVVHFELPRNLESYYQQIGRAGRDGLDSHCLLLYKEGDRGKIGYFIDQMEDRKNQQIARDHLNWMSSFAESLHCRRIELLRYFGEEYPKDNCGNCDNCQGNEKSLQDITEEAQKFLSCIARTGERFGANHIIDILRGANTLKIRENQHENLTTYGIGKDLSKIQWSSLSRQFLSQGLFRRDPDHGSLILGPQTGPLFRGEFKVSGWIPIVEKAKAVNKNDRYVDLDYSREIFDRLRHHRKELSMAEKVPPYVIFSDRTLIEMAQKKPRSHTDLLAISGVGLKKLEKYGQSFVRVIHEDESLEIKMEKEEGESLTEKIGKKFNQGIGLGALQDHFQQRTTSLIRHLSDFQDQYGSLDKEYLEQAVPLSEEIRNKALKLIREKGEGRLKEIQKSMDEDLTINQLKLLVLTLA